MQPTPSEIARIYERHPLRKDTLLARVLRDKGSLINLTENDLAIDRRTEITDQNNVGGAAAVVRLAEDLGLSRGSRVLDLGCGLGGPARLLAYRFGCRVDGIDISALRVRDASALTELVSLSGRVSIRRGDIMRVPVPAKRYDVIWGQSAWIHIADKKRLVARWSRALKTGGCMVVQDSCLRRAPQTAREAAILDQLERDWASSLIYAREWAAFASAAGLNVVKLTQSSRPLAAHFGRLRRAAARAEITIPARETRSWRAAITAAESRLIARFTLVACA